MSQEFGRSIVRVDAGFANETQAVSALLPFAHRYFDQAIIGDRQKIVFHSKSPLLLNQMAKAVKEKLDVNLECRECNFHCRGFASDYEEKIKTDVLSAYFSLLEESHTELKHKQCTKQWAKELSKAKKIFDRCSLIRTAKQKGTAEALKQLDWFVKPEFLESFIDLALPNNAKLVDSYSLQGAKVGIYSVAGAAEKYYLLTPTETQLSLENAERVSEVLDRITHGEAKALEPSEAKSHFKQLAQQLIGEENQELINMAMRHSVGYGLLELILSDDNIQDVYVDSPGDSPVYLYHAKHEECVTNIGLTRTDLEKLGSRLRALSGRPFDESSPVINTDLPDMGVRVCGLCPPATFSGYGFAFRRHKPSPWTLAQFIAAKMMDARTAGLLSFLVDGQRSLLITGPRGSGKSSLLSALIAEIPPLYRMVVIEDTPELPIEELRKQGHKVQHMRIKAALGEDEGGLELSAQEALRTALRLGESVLVIGEVRGPEAKSLFEAMRIGAAGNVVMGTIHGASAYDTWDRIVNDLGVPTTSFKATDAVISVASVRSGDETRRLRRLIGVTEVKKHWRQDPFHENGFNNLLTYSTLSDSWKHAAYGSNIFKEIAALKKMKQSEVEKNIQCRAAMKELLVKKSRTAQWLLDVGASIESNKEYLRIVEKQTRQHGSVNYREVLADYKSWLDKYSGTKRGSI
ncbi:type II/IV secretion system ATPase subunit [Candidatus Micrarchaeota archaeon]|nr:type II/IV secretion system ATPase subunit [Candidatus Micrarchaeota archaeon]